MNHNGGIYARYIPLLDFGEAWSISDEARFVEVERILSEVVLVATAQLKDELQLREGRFGICVFISSRRFRGVCEDVVEDVAPVRAVVMVGVSVMVALEVESRVVVVMVVDEEEEFVRVSVNNLSSVLRARAVRSGICF